MSPDLNPVENAQGAETHSLEQTQFKTETASAVCSREVGQNPHQEVQKSH